MLFSSMTFPDRAPNNLYLYTTFVGGSRNRELAKAQHMSNFNAFDLLLYCILFNLRIPC